MVTKQEIQEGCRKRIALLQTELDEWMKEYRKHGFEKRDQEIKEVR